MSVLALFFLKCLQFFVYILPRGWCLFLGEVFGRAYFYLDSKRRRIALSNLTIAFPNQDPSSHRKIALQSFTHFGRLLFDLVKCYYYSEEKRRALLEVEGKEYFQEVIGRQRGALICTAHYGNWEIAPAYLNQFGKLHVIARPLDNKLFENKLHQWRKRLRSEVIYKKEAAKKVLKALLNNEMVAILIDQNVLRSEGVFVDFFGKKASTTPALAAFHLRTGAPIIPGFCYPSSGNKYKIHFYPPLERRRADSYEKDILQITQNCTKIIEQQIRQYPQYWLWLHQRWKTRPEDEKGGDNAK